VRLSAEDLRQLAECAATAAKEAGALIAQYNGREVRVQHKSGGESLASQVVTEVYI
jgi:3'(2'), 5'-bisphosphate nucleotidase/myo-inositol-1(or 4)-monophosphatase